MREIGRMFRLLKGLAKLNITEVKGNDAAAKGGTFIVKMNPEDGKKLGLKDGEQFNNNMGPRLFDCVAFAAVMAATVEVKWEAACLAWKDEWLGKTGEECRGIAGEMKTEAEEKKNKKKKENHED